MSTDEISVWSPESVPALQRALTHEDPGVELAAGPLTALYQNGDLRTVCWAGREVVRRIYGAVRDRNWGTPAGVRTEEQIEQGPEGFQVTYRSRHLHPADDPEVDFEWTATLTGSASGELSYVFDGVAHRSFLRNRIGLCALVPTPECAGAAFRAGTEHGALSAGRFPERVSADQPVRGLRDLTSLEIEIDADRWVRLEFSGDLFEVEDQRNWIDASFKIYCTPLSLPFPMEITSGTRVRQEIRLLLRPQTPVPAVTPVERPPMPSKDVVTLRLDGIGAVPGRKPTFGVGLPDSFSAVDPVTETRLRSLSPHHLRLDLHSGAPDNAGRLQAARALAQRLDARLLIAAHLGGGDVSLFRELADTLRNIDPGTVRLLVLGGRSDKTTPPALWQQARTEFTDHPVELGVGTNADLYQLNQFPPPADGARFVAWSQNPQVHAFDILSLTETPAAVGDQLRTVRELFPEQELVVSPITLRPRFNAVATGEELPTPEDELPFSTDARQPTPFAAGWGLAMVGALLGGPTAWATLFETEGGRGLWERPEGPGLRHLFPSLPGGLYPLFHILAEINRADHAHPIPTSHPLQVSALRFQTGGAARYLIANRTSQPRRIQLGSDIPRLQAVLLSESDVLNAAGATDILDRISSAPISGELLLPPFALARLAPM